MYIKFALICLCITFLFFLVIGGAASTIFGIYFDKKREYDKNHMINIAEAIVKAAEILNIPSEAKKND